MSLWNPKKALSQPPHYRSIGGNPSPARDDVATLAANVHNGAQFDRQQQTARRGGRAVVNHGGTK